MAFNKRCPKCGSEKCQMVQERGGHGCLWMLLFNIFYLGWVGFKWTIGFFVLIFIDSWMAILAAKDNKEYIWQCRKWFTSIRRSYYCHDCGYNFKA